MATNRSIPIIITEQVQGGNKGQVIYLETQRILNLLMDIPLQRIQDECNRVANQLRDRWSTRNPKDLISEYNLYFTTYGDGIRELDPPFVLTRPSSIRINILDSKDDSNPEGAANVTTFLNDPLNPILRIFLPALNVIIRWINFEEPFITVIIHEFLHISGDVPHLRQGVVDGRIRHNMVGTKAIERLIRTKKSSQTI